MNPMNPNTYWDIETGPGDWANIQRLCVDSLTRDDGKMLTKSHSDPDEWKAAILDKAALSPLTGRVLAIGIQYDDGPVDILENRTCDDDGERAVLTSFWTLVHTSYRSALWDKWKPSPTEPRWIGFNTSGFDVPFLIARTQILFTALNAKGLPTGVPLWVQEGRHLHRMFLDLRERWGAGAKFAGPARGNLDTICRALGIEGKNGSGADFGKLYTNLETRPKAIEYLRNDIRMTAQCGKRLLRIP